MAECSAVGDSFAPPGCCTSPSAACPAWSDMPAAGLDLSDGYRWVGTVGSDFSAAWRVSNINMTFGKAFYRTQHGYVDSSSRGHAHGLVPWKPSCCKVQLLCLAPHWLSTRLTGQFAREHADLARSGRKEHGPSHLLAYTVVGNFASSVSNLF